MKESTSSGSEEIKQIVRELSELKRQNAELSNAGFDLISAQSKLHSFLHNASEGIITFSPDGTVESFNIAAQHIFGYSEAEVVTRKIPDLIPCPDWIEGNVGAYIKYFISSRASPDIPLLGKHRLGFDILLYVSTGQASNQDSSLFEDFENPDYSEEQIEHEKDIIVCFFRDITLDKRLEKELEDRKHALDLAAGVITRDKDFRVIDINDNFCSALGRKRQEFIGERFVQSKFGGRPDYEDKLQQRRDFLTKGHAWTGEACFLNQQGVPIWFSESTTPFLDENDEPYQYLSIYTDITYRKLFQNQIEQHRDHLQDLVDDQVNDIRHAKDEAERANKAKSDFLANMSHELRSPMHGIISFTHLCLKQFKQLPLDQKRTNKLLQFLNNIEISSHRLLALLNNLLDLSKLESGIEELNLGKYELYNLCQQIASEYSGQIQEKQIKFHLIEPEEKLYTICDRDKLLQVISNLYSNAIKFSSSTQPIYVSIKKDRIVAGKRTTDTKKSPGILLTVTDFGIGIPKAELITVFDKFIQSSKTKSGAGGTGLGLSICQEIIHAHKGRIWAEINPEGGAIFKVFIPNQIYKQDKIETENSR